MIQVIWFFLIEFGSMLLSRDWCIHLNRQMDWTEAVHNLLSFILAEGSIDVTSPVSDISHFPPLLLIIQATSTYFLQELALWFIDFSPLLFCCFIDFCSDFYYFLSCAYFNFPPGIALVTFHKFCCVLIFIQFNIFSAFQFCFIPFHRHYLKLCCFQIFGIFRLSIIAVQFGTIMV